jgi:uncharacterized protein
MQHKALALSLFVLISSVAIAAQSPPDQTQSQSASAASATDKPTRQQLLTLFEVMHLRSQMQDMLKMLPTALEQQLQSEQQEVELSLMPGGGPGLTDDQKAARDQITKKYFELAEKVYPTDEMLNDMVVVYQRHLTRVDVDGILAFYRSSAGQHLVEAQPVMAKEVMPMVMTKMEGRSKDLVNRYKKELNDAIGPPKIPPPAAPKS